MNDFYKELIERASPSSLIRNQTSKSNSHELPQTCYIRNVNYDQKSLEQILSNLGFSATVTLVNTDFVYGYSYQVTLKNK